MKVPGSEPDSTILIKQYEDIDGTVEGLRVECPFCDPDDEDGPGYQPRPFLASGECHECGNEFDVAVEWTDTDN